MARLSERTKIEAIDSHNTAPVAAVFMLRHISTLNFWAAARAAQERLDQRQSQEKITGITEELGEPNLIVHIYHNSELFGSDFTVTWIGAQNNCQYSPSLNIDWMEVGYFTWTLENT